MAIKPKNYFENRVCCHCGRSNTTQGFGSPRWHKHKCDKKDCTKFLCHKCYGNIQTKLPFAAINKIDKNQYNNVFHEMDKETCPILKRRKLNGKTS